MLFLALLSHFIRLVRVKTKAGKVIILDHFDFVQVSFGEVMRKINFLVLDTVRVRKMFILTLALPLHCEKLVNLLVLEDLGECVTCHSRVESGLMVRSFCG